MKCSRCKKPIASMYIGDDEGPSHTVCYHKAHPYKPKTTLREVLNNWDDQVLARDLVEKYAGCGDAAARIVAEFNERMQARYEKEIA